MKTNTTKVKASAAFAFCAAAFAAAAGNCSNARLDAVDGKLVVSVKPYFYIKIR